MPKFRVFQLFLRFLQSWFRAKILGYESAEHFYKKPSDVKAF